MGLSYLTVSWAVCWQFIVASVTSPIMQLVLENFGKFKFPIFSLNNLNIICIRCIRQGETEERVCCLRFVFTILTLEYFAELNSNFSILLSAGVVHIRFIFSSKSRFENNSH